MNVLVRKIFPGDADAVVGLAAELSAFIGKQTAAFSVDDFRRYGFGSDRLFDGVIAEVEGRLVAVPTICPHLMGPLLAIDSQKGLVRCPWHGYHFDIKSGKCLSPKHAHCTLPATPELNLSNGNIIARMP